MSDAYLCLVHNFQYLFSNRIMYAERTNSFTIELHYLQEFFESIKESIGQKKKKLSF